MRYVKPGERHAKAAAVVEQWVCGSDAGKHRWQRSFCVNAAFQHHKRISQIQTLSVLCVIVSPNRLRMFPEVCRPEFSQRFPSRKSLPIGHLQHSAHRNHRARNDSFVEHLLGKRLGPFWQVSSASVSARFAPADSPAKMMRDGSPP